MSLKSRNLEKRNGTWFVRIMYKGKRIRRSTGHGNRDLAWDKAKKIYANLVEGNDGVLESSKIVKGYVTIGRVIEEFRAGAAAFKVKPATVEKYVNCLKLIVRVSHPSGEIEKMSSDILTRGLVTAYRDAMLGAVPKGDERKDIRTRRTINSTVNQARSLFGDRWAMAHYRDVGLKLPDLSGFTGGRVCSATSVYYVRPDEDLVRRTKAAAEDLHGEDEKKRDDGLWAAYILCYWLALRGSEAAAARHSWIRREETVNGPRWFIYVISRPEEDGDWVGPKASEGKVPVPVEVVTWIEALKREGDDYILPGGNTTARNDLVKRDLAAWMRGLGWTEKHYPKAAHELRKLRGSEWYTERGIEAACAWLRHGDISTTKRFYAAFTHHPPTLEVNEVTAMPCPEQIREALTLAEYHEGTDHLWKDPEAEDCVAWQTAVHRICSRLADAKRQVELKVVG